MKSGEGNSSISAAAAIGATPTLAAGTFFGRAGHDQNFEISFCPILR
jgi:hypothetical protein